MKKIKVAIIFGGISEEHDISIKSAKEVALHINLEKYEPLYIGITRLGEWKICDAPSFDWEKNASHSVILSSNREIPGLFIIREHDYEIKPVDVIFPVIHGKMGEDGTIQGLLELSGMPYVGCGIQASNICMDKSLTYLSVQNKGIKIPEFIVLDKNDTWCANDLTYPVFVKPARSGSSFGVTKVQSADEFKEAIQTARQYDTKVLIEQAIVGAEVGCAVLGNNDKLITGEVDQIEISHGFFRIHQEESPENGSQNSSFIVPAHISQEKRTEIQNIAKLIYQIVGCTGLARVDMFLQKDGKIVLNEINTMPGFTSYSRYPRMMKAANIGFEELIDRCIMLAIERGSL